MAQSYVSGYASYVKYGYEASYGAGAVSARVFGHGIKITHTRRNSMERIYGLGARNAAANVAKTYEGTTSLEFVLSNASFFRGVLGAVADGGAGPSYTHTYTEANTVPSFAVDTGTELGTSDEVTELQGCKVGTMTLTAAQGEVVKVRLECPYKTETLATSGIGSASAETYTPFSFAQGIVEGTASGGEIGKVLSVELTLNNTLEGVWGLGSRLKAAEVEKIREYNIRMTVAFKDVTELLTKFYGQSSGPLATSTPAAQATIVLTFDTGGTGADSNKIVMTLANVYFDEETLPKDINEVMKEDVSGWALSGTSIVWTNGTSSDSATP
jgi:hypothetical protein